MKVFYDTEFIEDGETIDLISIGMVAEDGRELYLVDEAIGLQPLYDRIRNHNWLMENVVTGLPLARSYRPISRPGSPNVAPRAQGHFHLDLEDNRVVSRRFIRNAVREFLLGTDEVELWAWFGAYDHVLLAQLFGPMSGLPDGIPMWTNDLQQEIMRRNADVASLPKQADGHHNALADARHVKVLYEHITAGAR